MDSWVPWLTLGVVFGIGLTANAILRHLAEINASLKWQNARLAAHDQHAAQQHAASWAPPPSP